MALYHVIHNRTEGPLVSTDDLHNAGVVVDALMRARHPDDQDGSKEPWHDYWVRSDDGAEYYWDANYRNVFSAACFEEKTETKEEER